MREIYADHAATTYPRHQKIVDAMSKYLLDIGCSPGRGGYKHALDAARLVFDARDRLARHFNVPNAGQVVFTPSITYSLNLIIKGALHAGDHVIISSMEHNAVVRPLSRLVKEKNIQVERIACNKDGTLDPRDIKKAIKSNTRMVILTHASNVTGTVLPVYEVGELLSGTDILYCIDTAQTAGSKILDFKTLNCDFLAFTGHKGLLGPPGIGGFCISERAVDVTDPLVEGGTGSRSEEESQPNFLPDKFESGTQNVPGVAGLLAGLSIVDEIGVENINKYKKELTEQFINGLNHIDGIKTYGPQDASLNVATVSLNMDGVDNGDLSFILEQAYGIMTRSGLHCAPLAHQTIGTFPEGTIRFSFGYHNTQQDVEDILSALKEISLEKR